MVSSAGARPRPAAAPVFDATGQELSAPWTSGIEPAASETVVVTETGPLYVAALSLSGAGGSYTLRLTDSD